MPGPRRSGTTGSARVQDQIQRIRSRSTECNRNPQNPVVIHRLGPTPSAQDLGTRRIWKVYRFGPRSEMRNRSTGSARDPQDAPEIQKIRPRTQGTQAPPEISGSARNGGPSEPPELHRIRLRSRDPQDPPEIPRSTGSARALCVRKT